ncbi:MAG: biotin--[acetyl-CoA-carboxylase] ligase [Lachnospiraceae bacterium]|nr:biotin--[acetyl-CoA-carboxylase] ligase [Lachnospiraceae bacterium]
MKTEILTMLTQSDGYVSGQALCDRLGVSRTAVWKVINQLKEEGYEIESVTGKGYRITGRPDRITAEEIASRLNTDWAARSVRYFDSIDSTNNEAKRLAEQGAPHGTLVVAEEQTQGKGRRGRTWVTPAGTAIAMSLILRPEEASSPDNTVGSASDRCKTAGEPLHPDRAPMLTLVMGMAVASACREVCGFTSTVSTHCEQDESPILTGTALDGAAPSIGIKWPNDVVAKGRKICGILTEMSCEVDFINYVVIGIGINTAIDEFPPELQETAVSLHTLMGSKPDRAKLIAACMKAFERYYTLFMKTQDYSLLMAEYNELLVGKGGRVRVLSPGNEFEGISEGIDPMGELLVRREDGTTEAIFAGEVSVRGIYGYV